ncbi:hypothetical protein WG68_01770 [Arsukibacterium ikkense]|uniref:DUF2496 domain-containing protein n=1 Tax=Arsukibacterium ikkense TaxID=336831 RepID=A0A0M2V962_9GAMM|nr:hypothetical protein WG68_01770 [Arsukibacterium ikkense]
MNSVPGFAPEAPAGLAQAPQHVKLAVDLIMLLEQQQIADADIMAALEIVVNDYRNKLKVGGNSTSHIPAPAS